MTAVHEALERHRDELVGFVRRRAGHLVDPEDVVHRAAARALSSPARLEDPERARPWLYRIVRNALVDELRGLGLPTKELPEDLPSPEDDRAKPCRCAMDIASSLKPEYKEILERAVIDDVAVTEVARELGISANNASVRLHRARNALRAAVLERCGTTRMSECMDCSC